MIGTKSYVKGQTFRNPEASRARAEYAATLRDLGFTYTAIAQALGLLAHTKERARRIVKLGYEYRWEGRKKEVQDKYKGTFTGDMLDSVAQQTVDMRDYIAAQLEDLRVTISDPCPHEIYKPVVQDYTSPHGSYTQVTCGKCGDLLELYGHEEKAEGRPAQDENGLTLRTVTKEELDEWAASFLQNPETCSEAPRGVNIEDWEFV